MDITQATDLWSSIIIGITLLVVFSLGSRKLTEEDKEL